MVLNGENLVAAVRARVLPKMFSIRHKMLFFCEVVVSSPLTCPIHGPCSRRSKIYKNYQQNTLVIFIAMKVITGIEELGALNCKCRFFSLSLLSQFSTSDAL